MGALDDYLAEYEGREQAAEPAAKPVKAKKYTSFDELVGKPAPAPAETKPAQPSAAVQKKIDAGLLPVKSKAQMALEAISESNTAAGQTLMDKTLFGVPGQIARAAGVYGEPVSPVSGGSGQYRRAEDWLPNESQIVDVPAMAIDTAATGGPLSAAGRNAASALANTGSRALATPLGQKAVAGGVGAGVYSAAETAGHGGSPEEIIESGVGGQMLGSAFPVAGAIAKKGAQITGNAANKVTNKIMSVAEEDAVDDILDKVPDKKASKPTSQLEKRIGKEVELDPEEPGKDAVLQTAKKHGLGSDLLKQPIPKFADAVEAKKEAAGAEIGKYIDSAGQLTPGVRLDAIVDSFKKVRASHAVGSSEYKALTQKIEALEADYGNTNVVGGVARVPLWEVQDMATKAADQGYAGVGLSFEKPSAVRKLGRQTAYALRQPLYDEVNRVAVRNPASVGTPEGFAKARATFGELSNLLDVVKEAKLKVSTGKEGLFSRMDAWENLKRAGEGGLAASTAHLLHAPSWVSAAAGLAPFVKPAAHAANAEIARLINAARGGFPLRMYNAAAESLNVSPEIAARIWQQFAPVAAGATGSQVVSPQGGP